MAEEEGKVHVIPDTAAWKAQVEEAKATGKIIVVDFTATWCGPCRLMSPIFATLSTKFANLLFVKVDVDDLEEVASEWEVSAMPTFMFIKDVKKLDEVVGANESELEKKCIHYN